MSPIDWADWHRAYDDPASPLHRRLVQAHIADALAAAAPGPLTAISVCAGQGTDLLGVLEDHPRAGDVRARLVELDPRNAEAARAGAPAGVEVVTGDAAHLQAYAGAAPADLVLLCGVLGRIGDRDLATTIRLLPQLTATGGIVVWTRPPSPARSHPARAEAAAPGGVRGGGVRRAGGRGLHRGKPSPHGRAAAAGPSGPAVQLLPLLMNPIGS